jgi:predicted small lipoprotein YifL
MKEIPEERARAGRQERGRRPRDHRRNWPRAIILPALLAAITACGQKGPLVLPGHSKDTPWPVRANPPASDAGGAKSTPPDAPAGSDSGSGTDTANPPRDAK